MENFARSGRYIYIMPGIFEINFFLGNVACALSSVLQLKYIVNIVTALNQKETTIHFCAYDHCVLSVRSQPQLLYVRLDWYCKDAANSVRPLFCSIEPLVVYERPSFQEQKGSHESDAGRTILCDLLLYHYLMERK